MILSIGLLVGILALRRLVDLFLNRQIEVVYLINMLGFKTSFDYLRGRGNRMF